MKDFISPLFGYRDKFSAVFGDSEFCDDEWGLPLKR